MPQLNVIIIKVIIITVPSSYNPFIVEEQTSYFLCTKHVICILNHFAHFEETRLVYLALFWCLHGDTPEKKDVQLDSWMEANIVNA